MTDIPESRLADIEVTCQNCGVPVQGTVTFEGPSASVEKVGETSVACVNCGFVHWLTLRMSVTPEIVVVPAPVTDLVMIRFACADPMRATVVDRCENGDVRVRLGIDPPYSKVITCIPVADPDPFFTHSAFPVFVDGKIDYFRNVVAITPFR